MPPQDTYLLQEEVRREALRILGQLTPDELYDKVVKPFFKAQRWEVERERHRDLLLTTFGIGQRFAMRVRLEEVRGAQDPISLLPRIQVESKSGLAHRYPENDPDPVPLLKYIWILPVSLSEETREAFRQGVDLDSDLGERTEVWDLEALYRKLVKSGVIRGIEPLHRIYARHEADRHRLAGEGVFALNWCYRAFRLHLRQAPPEIDQALKCLAFGLAALAEDECRAIYYPRVFHQVFSAWQELLQARPDLFRRPPDKLEQTLEGEEIAATFGQDRKWLAWLLQDFERMFVQLELMEELFVNTPAGLSTLQLCRLLLRFGFAPSEPRISARLRRIREELEKEEGKSVDGGCSLCTGTVVSCLSLARQKDAEVTVDWLESLRGDRYCHMSPLSEDFAAGEHSLHYAATVLQGLLDFTTVAGRDDGIIASVLAEFFVPDELDSRGFYLSWMRYANIDRFEVYRYILAGFLRHRLMGKDLSSACNDFLSEAVRTLVRELKRESTDVQKTYLTYSARTNLTSLALGLHLGIEEAAELARDVTGCLRRIRRSRIVVRAGGVFWDSNVDRNVILIEGYLDYWETIFCLAEKDLQIEGFLPAEVAPEHQ
ncbi:MAG: hypothetical protein JF614_27125 [Acidobacteria bacterium]|nr:hypothetical protein [Acidobacteriota bacterium]